VVTREHRGGGHDSKYLEAYGGDKGRLLCDVTRWRVYASNSKKHLEVWSGVGATNITVPHRSENDVGFGGGHYSRSGELV
jgi:hypothetical protein